MEYAESARKTLPRLENYGKRSVNVWQRYETIAKCDKRLPDSIKQHFPSCFFGTSFKLFNVFCLFCVVRSRSLQKRSGMLFASNFHMKTGKNHWTIDKIRTIWGLYIRGSSFASLSGKTHFRQMHPKRKTKSLNSYEVL